MSDRKQVQFEDGTVVEFRTQKEKDECDCRRTNGSKSCRVCEKEQKFVSAWTSVWRKPDTDNTKNE